MKKLIFLLILSLSAIACEDNGMVGDCSNPVKFSEEVLNFNYTGGTSTVTANHEYWWIAEYIYIDGIIYYDMNDFQVEWSGGEEYSGHIIKIEGDWFTITRVDGYTLSISIDQNKTGKDRQLILYGNRVDCGCGITVSQSAE
ncbi:MAG: hypothetical protein LBT29_02130 [Flavobacteriaceae bacterium]|jgi:hypothetical protein|nr:hypothetical protein [Flavobacteriaceae bacterium]